MKTQIKSALGSSLGFSVIVLYLLLTGFVFTISEIISEWINVEISYGLIIFLVLFGLLFGRRIFKGIEQKDWKSSLTASILAGAMIGLVLLIFVLIVGSLLQADVKMREYLPKLSPNFVKLLLLGNESVIVGAIYNFFIFVGSTVMGCMLSFTFSTLNIGKKLMKRNGESAQKERISRIKELFQENIIIKYSVYAFGFAALAIIPQYLNESWNLNLGTIGIYILMGIGLNLVVGTAGLLDLGFVAFYAIGAYSVGLLTAPKPLGIMMDFWPAFFIGFLLAILSGFLIGIPVVRLRGDYLAIVTLGFGEITRVLIQSDTLDKWTGGPQGVKDIGQPSIFGLSIDSKREYFYIILVFIVIAFFITNRLQYSRIGRTWIAMREDETVAEAMGINTFKYKLLAFMIGASFAGIAGGMFAARNFFTGPADHTLMVSINVLSEIIVGGLNSIGGIITGAIVLKGLPEILRQVEDYRMVTFGALLVVMMIWRPEGLWPAKRRNIIDLDSIDEQKEQENE